MMDQLDSRWEDLWELSRMYVQRYNYTLLVFYLICQKNKQALCIYRLKALELVLNGIGETEDIVRKHEVTLASFDTMPADLEHLRSVHSQLLVCYTCSNYVLPASTGFIDKTLY